MQIGFPSKVEISTLLKQMETFLEPRHISLGKNLCLYIFFLAVGFKPKEFKIGKTEILIRPGKNHLIDKLNGEIRHSKNEIELKFKASFLNFMRKILLARFQLLGKSKFCWLHFFKIEFKLVIEYNVMVKVIIIAK